MGRAGVSRSAFFSGSSRPLKPDSPQIAKAGVPTAKGR